MKVSTFFRIIINKLKFLRLVIKNGNRVKVEGIQFFSLSTSILVGKGTIQFGKSIMSEKNCYFSVFSGGTLKIGEKSFFNRNCYVASREKIQIGSNCTFGPNVSLYDHDHCFSYDGVNKSEYKTAPIFIGNNCWIGDGVKILRGTTIGEGTIIGAGTIVKGVIPPHSIVTGTKEMVIRSIQ